MAKIHKSKNRLGENIRHVRRQRTLGWMLCVMTVAALAACCAAFWGDMSELGGRLAAVYEAKVVAACDGMAVPEAGWQHTAIPVLQQIVRTLRYAVQALPQLALAIVTLMLLGRGRKMIKPSREGKFLSDVAGMEGEKEALKAARRLSNKCHVFVNKYIPFEGRHTETDLILVGPGGMAVVEVKNWGGKVEGHVNDEKVERRRNDKMENPVRQVVRQSRALKGYLRQHGIEQWIVNCLFFVNPRVEVRMSGAARYFKSDENGVVIAQPHQFQDRIAKGLQNGKALNRAQIRRIVAALDELPNTPPETPSEKHTDNPYAKVAENPYEKAIR